MFHGIWHSSKIQYSIIYELKVQAQFHTLFSALSSKHCEHPIMIWVPDIFNCLCLYYTVDIFPMLIHVMSWNVSPMPQTLSQSQVFTVVESTIGNLHRASMLHQLSESHHLAWESYLLKQEKEIIRFFFIRLSLGFKRKQKRETGVLSSPVLRNVQCMYLQY